MTTPAQGKLAWSQAAQYDGVDDRAVITAVTGGRIGLLRPVVAAAGAGLLISIQAGWVGVASCDDLTSAVVGSRETQIVTANPGPAVGSREDVIWCDTYPDEGYWRLSVMPVSQSAGRSGIPIAWVTVPSNANLASQMTIRSVDAAIERRVLSVTYMPNSQGFNDYSAGVWGTAAGRGVESIPCYMEPGQWYRVRYTCHCCSLVGTNPPAGTRLEGRCGIGQRVNGQAAALSTMTRGFVVSWPYFGVPTVIAAEYVFRHDLRDAPVTRIFDGRVWTNGAFTIRPGGYTEMGPYVQTLTVEDIGS